MKETIELLEVNKIIDQIKGYCASSLGKDAFLSLTINDDQEELEETFVLTHEAMNMIVKLGRLPLGGLHDIEYPLAKAKRDGTLSPEELYNVALHLECVQSVKKYIQSYELEAPKIKDLGDALEDNARLLQEIQRCILPDLTISDHASDALYKIRKQIKQLESSVRHEMESIVKSSKDMLSIDQMTTKNERLVLPVKSGYKNQVKGLIHAYSATGQTTYIEPDSILSINNQIGMLKVEEREEIERILQYLSSLVKSIHIQLGFNQDILGSLDFIFAKGMFGYHFDCCIPQLKDSYQTLLLKEARHPLIDQKKVISNTIELSEHRMLLISGSNTGGKTVTLKTAGLLSYLALCGIPIPCSEAIVPMFDDIFVDIGDEQSITQSLSTFSSHMSRMIQILSEATSRSLVVLDEIGSGTDPREGESLAEAILTAFLDKGNMTLASTHFGKLKTFAGNRDDIRLASVTFDLERMRPTYKLNLDTVGQSYAIEISSLLGLPLSVLEHAKELKENAQSDQEKLMEKLAQQEELLNQKEEDILAQQKEVEKLKKQYNHHLHQIDQEKTKILDQAQSDAKKIVNDTKDEVSKIMEDLNQQSLKPHIAIAKKKELENLITNEDTLEQQTHELKIGDHVKMIKMNREGDIVDIQKNGTLVIDMMGLQVKLHENEVVFMHGKTKTKVKKVRSAARPTVKKTGTYELNIIGKRYEEAMDEVEKFLDDALVLNYPHVRIIHGMGTGALRKGVKQTIKKNRHVVSSRDGGPNEGGLGATLVYFE